MAAESLLRRKNRTSEFLSRPAEIGVVLGVLVGAGGIDEHAAFAQRRPHVGEYAPLASRANVHQLRAPFLHRTRVFAEHALAAAGHVGDDDVEPSGKRPANHCGVHRSYCHRGVAPDGDIVAEHAGTGFHDLVRNKREIVAYRLPERCCKVGGLAAGGGAQVEDAYAGGRTEPLKLAAEHMPHEHRGGVLHVITTRMHQGVEDELWTAVEYAREGAPGHGGAIGAVKALERIETYGNRCGVHQPRSEGNCGCLPCETATRPSTSLSRASLMRFPSMAFIMKLRSASASTLKSVPPGTGSK